MRGSRKNRLRTAGAAVAALAALAVPIAGATPANVQVDPGQRTDMKVLLISADGSEPGFGAWKAQLSREGTPYDTLVAYTGQAKTTTLTDARLADYGANHARYQAVILASGDLGHNVNNPDGTTSYLSAFTDAEWATLAKYERTFGIRRLSDYTAPSTAHGLNPSGGASQDGVVGTLTAAGKAAFPYLKGPVAIADDDPAVSESFGYPATPVNDKDWQTLLAGPNNTAYLGIYTHPDDGREELVMTVASNQFQTHNQLLRHGMLNWVTRGVFLGYQRNYLEIQVDDLFLGDDAWDPVTNTTNYDPAAASRMTPADVDKAIAFSQARGLRLDFAFNGGGGDLYRQQTGAASDPLTTKFDQPAVRAAFGFINHTYEHPNLDCSTSAYITRQITRNLEWAQSRGITVANPGELITGEHSGLANTRPGNPGTIDPPSVSDIAPAATGGTVPGGTYDYALTARSTAGETTASMVEDVVVGTPGLATNRVRASFNAVCHAVAYNLYRSPAGTGAWTRVATVSRGENDPTDNGTEPIELALVDTGAPGTAAAPPAANAATIAPYAQNPNFLAGLKAAGITHSASDSSKAYPSVPTSLSSPFVPAGSTFFDNGVQAVPRYPSNVYYNVSRQAQQLDEYNWIYTLPPAGNCVPVANVTTCRTTPATWAEYVASENRVMFRHVVDNDPRPHYIHQSNLADFDPALPETHPNQGGITYPVFGALVDRYEASFDRASTPLVQLTHTQIGQTLAQQDAWAANRSVTAWIKDGRVHVKNAGTVAADVPVTGTTAGAAYGGQKAGWITLAPGAEQVLAPSDPANTAAPTVTGSARVGETLTAEKGTWTGSAGITYDYRWQRCEADGTRCATVPGATATRYTLAAADKGSTVRVVVLAGNWVSSVSQAASATTGVIADAPRSETPSGGQNQPSAAPRPGSSPTRPTSRTVRLKLTQIKMAPRRFAVARKRPRTGTQLDGSRITFRVNTSAKVRLVVQRRTSGRKARWVTAGTITRSVKAGSGEVRLTGRFGKRLLRPSSYRVSVSAVRSGQKRTTTKRISFRVVKG